MYLGKDKDNGMAIFLTYSFIAMCNHTTKELSQKLSVMNYYQQIISVINKYHAYKGDN